MQVIQQFKKHTTSNKNHKSLINRGVKNHTFKFNKHTFNSYIKNMHRITSIGVGSSFLLVLLILAICIPLYKDELNTKATTGTSTQATTSLALSSGASSTASVDLTASSTSGSFVSGGSASYDVYTTNYTGYTLLVASSSTSTYNDGKLTMSGDSSNYFSTITDTSGITANTFSNASSGSTYNGKWGLKPSKYYNTSTNTIVDNTDTTTGLFFPAPTVSGFTIAKTTTANGSTTSTASSNANNYTLSLGARADYTQIAGTYTNTYVLQAVGNAITYNITYSDNTGDSSVANLPYFNGNTANHTQAGSVSTTSITLRGSGTNNTDDATPTRTGYTFTGWCNTTTTESGTKCNGSTTPTYTAGGNYGIDQTTANDTTLYALWTIGQYDLVITGDSNVSSMSVKAGSTSGTSTTCTQSGTTFTCSNLTYGTNYYLYPVFASGYEFNSWSKTDSTTSSSLSSTTTENAYYHMGAGAGALTLTSKASAPTITFNAGSNIDYVIVADGSDNYKPYYATSGNPVSFTNKTAGTMFIVTVVPKANYKLSSWSGDTGNLVSTALLTTTYTVPSGSATLTVTGTSGTYTPMSSLTTSSCSTSGTNVTDTRNGVSYTVKKISLNGANTCFMLSNLRLAGGATLTTSNSNVTASYTLPSDTGSSGWTDDYCKPYMASKNGEYYYNWPAATARTNSTSNTSSCSNDTSNSVGDICPLNWRIPANINEVGDSTWRSNLVSNGLLVTTGYFLSGLQYNTGSRGYWWSSARYSNTNAYRLYYGDDTANGGNYNKTYGFSVRCMMLPNQLTITYSANNGSGSIASQTVALGSSVTLADNSFTRTNYYFKGWATSSGGAVVYRPSQSITPTGNMTLYAVWGSSTNANLYDAVASLTRGNQTNNTNATTGIKTNPTKATSGVYTYNASVFGTSSDSSNTKSIYYYRGILDTDLDGTSSTYGSNGNSMNYPNYVKLGDMCWRIVRTTGSGGVKMIYNGSYSGGTTANSCANATTNAQLTTQAFGLKGNSAQSNWYNNINRIGYTFNNTQSLQDSTTSTSVDTVFGSDSSPSTNNERSNIKEYIEDTWYANNMTSWTSKLEASAGYCNDRSAFSNNTGTTTLTTIQPFRISPSGGQTVYFGAYTRNDNSNNPPSLTCSRNSVDLYRYVSGGTGVSNQLKYPVALLTADEASFAGSGSSTASKGSGYHYNSYLHSGSEFWLFSPRVQNSYGNAHGYILSQDGYFSSGGIGAKSGVRPVISLVSGTKITSGSGTATSPWVVQ